MKFIFIRINTETLLRGKNILLTFHQRQTKKVFEIDAFIKPESKIDYPYLDDTKTGLDENFKIENGVINWEGSVASAFDGNGDEMRKYPNINFKYFETDVTDKNLNLVINL